MPTRAAYIYLMTSIRVLKKLSLLLFGVIELRWQNLLLGRVGLRGDWDGDMLLVLF